MRRLADKIEKAFIFFERGEIDFYKWLFTIFSIFTLRFFVELISEGFLVFSSSFFVSTYFLGIVLFFLLMSLVFTILFLKITDRNLKQVSNGVLWGMIIIIFPPILDKVIFKDKITWSFYLFDGVKGLFYRFITFFGDSPDIGITTGTRIGAFLVSFVFAIYLWSIKKKLSYLFFGAFISYLIVFIFSSVPSLISFLIAFINKKDIFSVTDLEVADNFLQPLRFFAFKTNTISLSIHLKLALFYNVFLVLILIYLQKILNKEKLKALFWNIRFPQMIFNFGLFFLGVLIGVKYFPQNFELNIFSVLVLINLLFSIFFVWKYSVVVNDINDQKIDRLSDANKNRPLIKNVFNEEEYRIYGLIFLFLSLINALTVDTLFFFLIIFYVVLTFIYSSPPLRLRRFIGFSSFLASFSSLLFFLMGFLLLSGKSLFFFPWRVFLFLFVFYGLILPIKDLKDRKADKENGVITLATWLGDGLAREVLSLLIFIAYIASVFLLKDFSLFFPAVLFGGLNYFIIGDKKVKISSLLFWTLLFVFLYGVYIVLISVNY